jgi:hypothetical protein
MRVKRKYEQDVCPYFKNSTHLDIFGPTKFSCISNLIEIHAYNKFASIQIEVHGLSFFRPLYAFQRWYRRQWVDAICVNAYNDASWI